MRTIEEIKERNHGFVVDSKELAEIVAINRLQLLLVRCGMGRFTAPAQDVAHFMDCVAKGGDYVRDVSFPA